MADKDKISTRYHYQFIHNVYGHFFHDTLKYFSDYLYPRFEHTVVGTYDKAVEYITKTAGEGREMDKPNLPALILNPSGEYNISDDGGKQLWRFPNLAPGMLKRIFEPIYQDVNVLVNVGFTRVKGEIELLVLLPSFYEYCDVKMFILQIFGGTDRIIYPRWFNSFIILSDELYNYEYTDPDTGKSYKLKWDEAGVTSQLIRTTAQTEYVFPCRIKPLYKLTGVSDGSTRYGGADKLADWRLSLTIEYQVEMPSFIVLESDYLAENINLEIRYGSCYSENSAYNTDDIPVNREYIKSHWDLGLDSTSFVQTVLTLPEEATITESKGSVFKTRYFHEITQAQADSTSDYNITMPEPMTDPDLLMLNSVGGVLSYGDHYTISTNGNTLTIRAEYTNFSAGDILELYVYEEN